MLAGARRPAPGGGGVGPPRAGRVQKRLGLNPRLRPRDLRAAKVTYPDADGGVLRAQALWADAKLIGIQVPEGSLLKTLVKNLVNADAALYEYTRDHE